MTQPNPFGGTTPLNPFGQPGLSPNPAMNDGIVTAPAPSVLPPGVATPSTAPADPFAGDPFGAPAPQRGKGPSIECLYMCLCLWMPRKLEEGIVSRTLKTNDGKPVVQDRMTVDIAVLDAGQNPNGQVPWGGKPFHQSPALRRPHDQLFATPGLISGAFVSQVALVSQLKDAYHAYRKLGAGQPGTMVLGRLIQGEAKQGNNPPWIIAPFDSLTDNDKAKARAWLTAHPMDQFGAPR